MKKKILITAIVVIAFLAYGVYWAFFDMSRLPEGELISEAVSPNGTYTVKAYISSGGATTDFAIRGELNYNTVSRKPKDIYWNYREDKAVIEWVDDNTVIINGHKLNVLYDRYDFRIN